MSPPRDDRQDDLFRPPLKRAGCEQRVVCSMTGGCDEGARRAAVVYTIETAKLNGIDPQVWLADVLARLPN
jgi:IS66 C-terminal element